MTLSERKLWKELRKLDAHWRRQAPIGRYIADFACHGACLVIELDGGCHDLPEVRLRDEKRDAWLRPQGYRVLRVRNEAVFDDLLAVIEMIKATLPPRWGKGRDGGERAEDSGRGVGGETPRALFASALCAHPRPCPSPIEGEGALDSESSAP
jgi:very-short-patch-repair endonuclease